MQEEHVTGVGLAARGMAQQQRRGTVGLGLSYEGVRPLDPGSGFARDTVIALELVA